MRLATQDCSQTHRKVSHTYQESEHLGDKETEDSTDTGVQNTHDLNRPEATLNVMTRIYKIARAAESILAYWECGIKRMKGQRVQP